MVVRQLPKGLREPATWACLAIDLMLCAYLALEMRHFRTARRP
jgi:hypothetical protein